MNEPVTRNPESGGPRDNPAAPKRVPDERNRSALRWSLAALAALLVAALTMMGFYAVRAAQALTDISRQSGLMPDYAGRPAVASGEPGNALNFVLLGSDTRDGERGRSDVLILAHLTAAKDKLYLISFPRDMYVSIPGHGKNKINAAYSFGGAALTVQTIEELLDLRLDHTAIIDFEGFIGLSDAIGGVSVFNEVDSSNEDYHFPRGDITLSGEKLLSYVRQRHGLARGDLDRAARQRAVLKAMATKLATPSTLANPVTFSAVTAKLGRFLTVDDALTNQALWQSAAGLRLGGSADVRSLQAPISGFGTSPSGAAIDIVDTARLAELAAALRADDLDRYWQENRTE